MNPRPEFSDTRTGRHLPLSLSYRLFLYLTVSMGLLVSLLLLAASQEFEELEKALGSERNHAELERLRAEQVRNPDYIPLSIKGIRVWIDDDPSMPDFLRELKPGFDDEVEYQGDSYAVLVDKWNGHRITISSLMPHIEDAENEIRVFLQASWLAMMIAIAGIGWLLTSRMIRPIARFAEKIDRLDPAQRGIQLDLGESSDEVERMTRAFNRYLAQMDDYVERQHAFAAMASHELRSPLTVVQTSAELIESLSRENSIRQHSRRIQRSSRSMDRMIRALLAVTRDHDPKQDFETVDLRILLQEILDQRQGEGVQQTVSIELYIPTGTSLHTHRELLRVVINNLLENAIRHSNSGPIRIHWRKNRLCITDLGPGIDETAVEHLFERGVCQGKGAGYGLGLYISRLVCERLDWQLVLRNTGSGTQACIILPPVA